MEIRLTGQKQIDEALEGALKTEAEGLKLNAIFTRVFVAAPSGDWMPTTVDGVRTMIENSGIEDFNWILHDTSGFLFIQYTGAYKEAM